eukprot:TRINITY_DN49278_c0_g1_i1.p1 TRINITY_DN49278_c0_g1~~TRINITY_DN49278_c0_g1_i1.p1  ORF type:complete len:308 (-),score=73.27 TRINITY_DN49278_c0_g1_i1:185-1108(-)
MLMFEFCLFQFVSTEFQYVFVFFFFKQKTAYEMLRSLVGSEMCIRDRSTGARSQGMEEAGAGLHTFVINLTRSQERWEHMQRMVAHLPVEKQHLVHRLHAVEGTDAASLPHPWATRVLAASPSRRAGDVGCAISHSKLWDKILEMNLPTAIVLEDDVTFSQELLAVTEAAYTAALGSAAPGAPILIWLSCEWESQLAANQQGVPLEVGGAHVLWRLHKAEWMNQGTRGYMLNAQAVCVLCQLLKEQALDMGAVPRNSQLWHIDWWMLKAAENGPLQQFFIRPNLVAAAELHSQSVRRVLTDEETLRD